MANAAEAEKVVRGFPLMAGEITYAAPGGDAATVLNAAEAAVAKMLGLKPDDMAKTRQQIQEAM